MSIVIIGGHDRMVRQYETICKKHNCKAKIFTQMPSCLNKKIGNPDLVVLFTNTVSHKMVRCAVSEAKSKKSLKQSGCINRNFRATMRNCITKKYKKPLDSILKLEYTNKL